MQSLSSASGGGGSGHGHGNGQHVVGGASSIGTESRARHRLRGLSQSVYDLFAMPSTSKGSKSQQQQTGAHHLANRSARAVITLFSLALLLIILTQLIEFMTPATSPTAGTLWGGAVAGLGWAEAKLRKYPEKYVADTPGFQASTVDSATSKSKKPVRPIANITRTYAEGINREEDPVARLIVLTMNRASSLRRLLHSLAAADYGDDHVDLDIWIDRKPGREIERAVQAVSEEIVWKHGTKTIYARLENGGLYQQWIYTWNITDQTDEVAVILEDDLEVSKAFYQWLKQARSAYAADAEVGAFTLQRSTLRPRQIPGVASGPLRIGKEHTLFKYRLLGTWGFAPQRDVWVEFREWFEKKRRNGEKPYVPHLVTTQWYKSQEKNGFAPSMWSQWWIKFADEKNYFTVTPHLPDGTTLAANWREHGMHYSRGAISRDFPVYKGSADRFSWPENPIKVDWDGREL